MVEHKSVLLQEAIEGLHIKKKGRRYIDATLGVGGHAAQIISAGGQVLGIEADPEMLALAKKNVRGRLELGNFRDISEIAARAGFGEVDGIIFDLGISSLHYKEFARGFSFAQSDAPLDMRLNKESQNVSAADLLKILREDQLINLFESVMGGYKARKLAQKIVLVRQRKEIKKVGDLLAIVGEKRKSRTHPATEVFLALRIAVNSELENLKEALPKAFFLLRGGGRLVIITFHSLEDALVKSFFREMAKTEKAKIITKKPIVPSAAEVTQNPSARSAKLRIIEKI